MDPRCCISKKLLGGTDAVGPGTSLSSKGLDSLFAPSVSPPWEGLTSVGSEPLANRFGQ